MQQNERKARRAFFFVSTIGKSIPIKKMQPRRD